MKSVKLVYCLLFISILFGFSGVVSLVIGCFMHDFVLQVQGFLLIWCATSVYTIMLLLGISRFLVEYTERSHRGLRLWERS